jgi:hypothetical protein
MRQSMSRGEEAMQMVPSRVMEQASLMPREHFLRLLRLPAQAPPIWGTAELGVLAAPPKLRVLRSKLEIKRSAPHRSK